MTDLITTGTSDITMDMDVGYAFLQAVKNQRDHKNNSNLRALARDSGDFFDLSENRSLDPIQVFAAVEEIAKSSGIKRLLEKPSDWVVETFAAPVKTKITLREIARDQFAQHATVRQAQQFLSGNGCTMSKTEKEALALWMEQRQLRFEGNFARAYHVNSFQVFVGAVSTDRKTFEFIGSKGTENAEIVLGGSFHAAVGALDCLVQRFQGREHSLEGKHIYVGMAEGLIPQRDRKTSPEEIYEGICATACAKLPYDLQQQLEAARLRPSKQRIVIPG